MSCLLVKLSGIPDECLGRDGAPNTRESDRSAVALHAEVFLEITGRRALQFVGSGVLFLLVYCSCFA